MTKYYIWDREGGNIIDFFTTLEEAEKTLLEYEKEDIREGIYIENFYEVGEVED